uniref:Uncharacterized protein LOC104266065 n=1 Tax=Phallusia mammillata TaxID=59560 RepID=A0A6F9DI98_9ASCI|nr:uncharacterized protein LOC104266065 [Phallusia mammillata]
MRLAEEVIYGNLTKSETQSFNVLLHSTSTFKFYTTSGSAVCYGSSKVSSPDASNNEFMLYSNDTHVEDAYEYSVDENTTLCFLVEGTSQNLTVFYLEINKSELPDSEDEESNKTTTTQSSKTQTPKNNSSKLSTEEIVGITVGCIAIAVVIAILLYLWLRDENPNKVEPEESKSSMATNAQAAIMEVQQTQIHEIRQYSRPPAGVHEVMKAVYLLLGHESSELTHWQDIQRLLGERGTRNIRTRVLEVDPRNITIQQARNAKEQTKSLDTEAVQKISVGLTLFYQFVCSMIDEVEKIEADENYSPNRFAAQGRVLHTTTVNAEEMSETMA